MTSTDLALRTTPPATHAELVTLGQGAVRYMAFKQQRLTAASRRSYTATIRDLLAHLGADCPIKTLEPPTGSMLLEDFLVARYGHLSGRTYNRGLSVVNDFVRWLYARGLLDRDPTLTLERAKTRQIHRTIFTVDQRAAILKANPEPREQVALRLLLDYGLRKGALRNVQLEHFNHERRQLVIFTKGQTIHEVQLPDPELWDNLAEINGPGRHFLLPKQTTRKRIPPTRKELQRLGAALADAHSAAEQAVVDPNSARDLVATIEHIARATQLHALAVDAAETRISLEPEKQIGEHGMHLLWYRWLARAGVVERGVTRGERLHKARHSAGQRVLDATGNLKAVQAVLGHRQIGTTGDVYTAWSNEQVAESLIASIPGLKERHERGIR